MNEEQLYNFISRVAYYNPVGMNKILAKYGCVGSWEPHDIHEVIDAGVMLHEQHGDEFLRDVVLEHPDIKIFRNFYGDSNMGGSTNVENPNITQNTTSENRVEILESEIKKTRKMLAYVAVGAIIYLILK